MRLGGARMKADGRLGQFRFPVEIDATGRAKSVRGGVVGTHRESIGLKRAVEQSKASETPASPGKARALPIRSMPTIGGAGSNPAPALTTAFHLKAVTVREVEPVLSAIKGM